MQAAWSVYGGETRPLCCRLGELRMTFRVHWNESSTGLDEDFDIQGSWAVPVADWRSPEKSVERDEFWLALRGCLDTLPDNLRTVFSLRELDGLERSGTSSVKDAAATRRASPRSDPPRGAVRGETSSAARRTAR